MLSKSGSSLRSLLLVRCGQRLVTGIDGDYRQQARRLSVTRVLAHLVMRAGHLVPAFSDLVDLDRFIINLDDSTSPRPPSGPITCAGSYAASPTPVTSRARTSRSNIAGRLISYGSDEGNTTV